MLEIVELNDQVAQTFFDVRAGVCGARLNVSLPMEIRIRRKGSEDVMAVYPVWQKDELGRLSFYWDDTLLSAPVGFYEGDVYVNAMGTCTQCGTVQFRKRACNIKLTNATHVLSEDFTPPCSDGGLAEESIAGDECASERTDTDCGSTPIGMNQPAPVVPECTPCGGAGYASGEVAGLPSSAILDTIGEAGDGEGCPDGC